MTDDTTAYLHVNIQFVRGQHKAVRGDHGRDGAGARGATDGI